LLIHAFATHVRSADGRRWAAQAWTAREPKGAWRAWLVFVPAEGGAPAWTEPETTLPNLPSVRSWATELTAAQLEAAVARALERRGGAPKRRVSGEQVAVKEGANELSPFDREAADEAMSSSRRNRPA
jgi:hypothetical protein